MRIGPPRYCGIGFVFFVIATLAPSGAEVVLHQSFVECGTSLCIYVVSLGLSSSSDEYHCSHSCLGTGMRVGK